MNNFAEIYTEEGLNLPEIPWNVYPRPLMKRDSFLCLNGEWDYAISKTKDKPADFDGKILVPYSPESELSGAKRQLKKDEF